MRAERGEEDLSTVTFQQVSGVCVCVQVCVCVGGCVCVCT